MSDAIKLIIYCLMILIVGFVIIVVVDRIKYNKKLNSCGNWIPLKMIPEPSRVVHCCTDLENTRYGKGDIFVLQTYEYNEFKRKADPVTKYYIAFSFGNLVELSSAQIDRIETIYKMKIRDGK